MNNFWVNLNKIDNKLDELEISHLNKFLLAFLFVTKETHEISVSNFISPETKVEISLKEETDLTQPVLNLGLLQELLNEGDEVNYFSDGGAYIENAKIPDFDFDFEIWNLFEALKKSEYYQHKMFNLTSTDLLRNVFSY